jgi:hypothetical protein
MSAPITIIQRYAHVNCEADAMHLQDAKQLDPRRRHEAGHGCARHQSCAPAVAA